MARRRVGLVGCADISCEAGGGVSNVSSVEHELEPRSAELSPKERCSHAAKQQRANQVCHLGAVEVLCATGDFDSVRQGAKCVLINGSNSRG